MFNLEPLSSPLSISVTISRTRANEAHTAGAYPGFRNMKQLRVLLLAPPPRTGCLSIAGLPLSSMSPVPIYTPGWREVMWGKVSLSKETT